MSFLFWLCWIINLLLLIIALLGKGFQVRFWCWSGFKCLAHHCIDRRAGRKPYTPVFGKTKVDKSCCSVSSRMYDVGLVFI